MRPVFQFRTGMTAAAAFNLSVAWDVTGIVYKKFGLLIFSFLLAMIFINDQLILLQLECPMKIKTYLANIVLIGCSFPVGVVIIEMAYRVLLFSETPAFDSLRKPENYADYFSDDD